MAEDAGTGDIRMSEREEYLGDELYASFDGYQIRLRAPRGFGVDHEVFLDQTTAAGFPRVYRCTTEMRVKKPRPGRKIDMAPRLRGAFSFVPHDREVADAIQIDRIEFIASPSFDIRIGF